VLFNAEFTEQKTGNKTGKQSKTDIYETANEKFLTPLEKKMPWGIQFSKIM
jgi:hypothetical protein